MGDPSQRLSLNKQVTASLTGVAVFTFPAPPTDLVWHGTLTCQTAPTAAVFAATVAGTPWSSWSGASIGGPVQALPGEVVQVTATGLTANTVFTVQWIGRSDPLSSTAPSYPDTSTSPPGGITATVVQTNLSGALEVYEVGGLTYVSNNNGSATTTALLGPPGAGNVYRLQRAVYSLGSGATNGQLLGDLTQNQYAETVSASDRENLDGLCVFEALDWKTIGGGGQIWLYYDLIPKPTLLAPKQIGIVQILTNTGGGTNTQTVKLPGVTVGHLLIAALGAGGNHSGLPTISTTGGTTSAWTVQAQTNQTTLAAATIWAANVLTLDTDGSVTVQTTWGNLGSTVGQLAVYECSQVNGTADATSAQTGTGTAMTAAACTPGNANDLAIAVSANNFQNTTSSPPGWVRDGTTGTGGFGGLAAHLLPSGSGALTPTFTESSSGSWALVVATFPSL